MKVSRIRMRTMHLRAPGFKRQILMLRLSNRNATPGTPPRSGRPRARFYRYSRGSYAFSWVESTRRRLPGPVTEPSDLMRAGCSVVALTGHWSHCSFIVEAAWYWKSPS
jgi:hypothetical protein